MIKPFSLFWSYQIKICSNRIFVSNFDDFFFLTLDEKFFRIIHCSIADYRISFILQPLVLDYL